MTTDSRGPGRVLVPRQEYLDDTPPGLRVELWPGASAPPPEDPDDVLLFVAPYDDPHGIDLVDRLPNLRAVQLLTAGYEHALPRIRPGVELFNGAGLHDASTAELALALILAAQRELDRWVLQRERGIWDRHLTRSLAGCRVLLLGYGGIGRAIEQRLVPFEVESITRVAGRARPDDDVHAADELLDLLPAADIVVLAVPQSAATAGLIGARELALLPDGALVVNVGRGPALDTAALLAEGGRIRAALDVTDPEPPPPGHPLWTAPGVIFSPHIGGGSDTFAPRARRFVAEQLARWASGEPLINKVEI